MYTLSVTLKQHTPLIHFQHDQEGATLRASEVKPKLDRFILTRLGHGDYNTGFETAKASGWLIGKGEHPALNYKMRIEAKELTYPEINERQVYTRRHEQRGKPYLDEAGTRYLAKRRNSDQKMIFDLSSYPLFFANLDTDYTNPNEYRRFSFTEKPLLFRLSSTNGQLFSFIKDPDLLNDFFFQTNFGTRQSKGFGSFSIDDSDPLYRKRHSEFWFTIYSGKWEDIRYLEDEFHRVFEYIELFYKSLRGGINLKKSPEETVFYFKSLAFMYAENVLNAKWDKRKVKEEFYGIGRNNMPHEYDVRDMLGFSTNENWLSYHDSIEKKAAVWDLADQRYRLPRREEKPPVERMPSPILIKPIFDEKLSEYTIYLLCQDDKVNMQGFKDARKVFISSRSTHRSFGIDLPQEFSSESFLNYIFREMDFDVSTHVENQYHNHRYFEILDDIYQQIKNNL